MGLCKNESLNPVTSFCLPPPVLCHQIRIPLSQPTILSGAVATHVLETTSKFTKVSVPPESRTISNFSLLHSFQEPPDIANGSNPPSQCHPAMDPTPQVSAIQQSLAGCTTHVMQTPMVSFVKELGSWKSSFSLSKMSMTLGRMSCIRILGKEDSHLFCPKLQLWKTRLSVLVPL